MLAIVNADDLGISRRVNETIFAMMSSGRVTSATLLANAPQLQQAVEALPRFSDCSFGVHLNLTQFRPLCPCEEWGALLDESGSFIPNKVREIRLTSSLFQAIEREWSAQIEQLLSLEVRISHIDSHHHVHTMPQLLPILKRLQRKYELRKVRISRNIYACDTPGSKRHLFKKRVYNAALRCRYPTTTTVGFTDLLTFHANGQQRAPRHQTVEIMVHPGGPGYEEETRLLGSEWWKELSFPVALINYHQLK